MRDLLHDAAEALNALLNDFDEFESLAGRLKDTKVKLDATEKAHAEVSEALETGKGVLDEAKREALHKIEQDIFQKGKALTQVTDQLTKVQGELADANAKVAAARQEHDQVLASMESLRKRLG